MIPHKCQRFFDKARCMCHTVHTVLSKPRGAGMRDRRYYIRLPASPSEGIKGGYYPIDPAALKLSILMQLYRRDDRNGRFVRTYDIEPSIELHNDPSSLLARWGDLMDQIEQLMPDAGLAGDFSQE